MEPKQPFNQAHVLGALAWVAWKAGTELNESVSGGICQTLALRWIQVKLQEVSRRERGTAYGRVHAVEGGFLKAGEIHAESGKGPNPMAEAEEQYEIQHLARLLHAPFAQQSCGVNDIAALVTSHRRACYLYRFSYTRDDGTVGGHAIAMYRSSGKLLGLGTHVYVFDPNFGEYKIASSSFRAWLEEHRRSKYKVAEAQDGDEVLRYKPGE